MNDRRQFPFRLTQIALKNIRDENAFLSPLATEKTFEALKFIETRPTTRNETNIFQRNFPFFFPKFSSDRSRFDEFRRFFVRLVGRNSFVRWSRRTERHFQ